MIGTVVLGATGFLTLAFAETVLHLGARFAAARALDVGGVRFFIARLETRGASNASRPRRWLVACAGLATNYLFAFVLFTAAFRVAGTSNVDEASMRIEVVSGGPADTAGLRRGDRIVSVEGERVIDWSSMKRTITAHPQMPIDVTYARDGHESHVEVTPDARGRIMIGPLSETIQMPLGTAMARGALDAIAVPYYLAESYRHALASPGKTSSPSMSDPRELAKSRYWLFGLAVFASYFVPIFALVALVIFPRAPRMPGTVAS